MSYRKQSAPSIIPVPGGKRIEEHFGGVATGDETISIARMVAPPGWAEPVQQPDFDEYTLMVRGRKRIEVDGEVIELVAGESLLVHRGTRVRYANPFDLEAEYWSVCTPAFSPDLVNREDG
ncbi:MAG: cupin domain-containing protein [Alkalispirochaetaceae bacterium]